MGRGHTVDVQTREAIRHLAAAVDSVSGMAAGIAAYVAAMEGAPFVDRHKALGLSRKLVPEGMSGDDTVSPSRVAQAMIEQIGSLAKEINALKRRLEPPPTHFDVDREPRRPAVDGRGALAGILKSGPR